MIETNGIRLHVVQEGEGTPVLLLHGFPDSSYLWRHQIPALAAAGHHVIAPDLRGYGKSDKPEGVDQYGMSTLVADAVGLLDALGLRRAHVVGHDWGAVLAWSMAILAPERVDRLTVLSVGHPSAFARPSMEQMARSWYMLLFAFEGLAEKVIPARDWWFLRTWARTGGDLDRWIEDLSGPGALTAALNWYRANVPPERLAGEPIELPPVSHHTMGIWSSGDVALTERQMQRSEEYVRGRWRYERVEGVGHWMQVEAPDRVNELLLDWLGK